MASRTTDTAKRDRLTGLPNLAAARERLSSWLAAGTTPVYAMYVSVARIDRVNVAYGQPTGDGALVEIAQRIRAFANEELAGEALVVRSSGNSFMVLARDANLTAERFAWVAEQVADRIAAPIADTHSDYLVRLFPRITLHRSADGSSADGMFGSLAEAAARLAEAAGQRIAWADRAIEVRGRTHHQLEHDLIGALDRDEIEVLFQPQYRAADDGLIGAEALARWYHPTIGKIGAATLFTIAGRAEHTAQLSRHIARKALLAARGWPDRLKLSLNITPDDLAPGSFAADFATLLATTGLPPERLTLEITEQVLLADLDHVHDTLEALRGQGVSLSLDDFGAGFCNFRYLKMLPIDTLKLDRAMIVDVLTDPRDLAVFRAIVAMARALELAVLVEGIETAAQRDLIRAEGCDYYQGFYRAEPMSGAAFLSAAMDG